MKQLLTLFFLIALNNLLFAQITEKLLLNCQDSSLLNKFYPKFDDTGNFLFHIETDSGDVVITKTDTVGPMHGFATGGMSSHSHPNKEKGDYYLSDDLPYWFGPTTGANWSYFRRPESDNKMHEFVAIQEGDHVDIFNDGRLIKQIDTLSGGKITVNGKWANQLANKKNQFNNKDWAALSNNGNVIYSLEENRIHHLYVNHELVDTSNIRFYNPMINNSSDYIYYKTLKVGEGDDAKYFRYVHTKDTIIGPIKTYLWERALMNNGGYFYIDSEKYNELILINNHVYIDSVRSEIQEIIIPDDKHYLCLKERNKQQIIHANGKTYELDYTHIYAPAADNGGNFAVLVVDDYFLYRWINGTRDSKPITKYGVRPKPIALDAKGNAVVEYEVNDSCYIYRNDQLLFQALKKEVAYADFNIVASYFPDRKSYSNGQQLIYLVVNDSAYFIENAAISKAIPAVRRPSSMSSKESQIGEIISGGRSEEGYYLIWKEATNKFTILINGKIVDQIEGVERIFNTSAFDGKRLIFYGIKGLSLYQFTLEI